MISVSVGSNLLPPLFPRPFFLFAGWGLLGCIVLMTASSLLPHLRRWAFQPW